MNRLVEMTMKFLGIIVLVIIALSFVTAYLGYFIMAGIIAVLVGALVWQRRRIAELRADNRDQERELRRTGWRNQ